MNNTVTVDTNIRTVHLVFHLVVVIFICCYCNASIILVRVNGGGFETMKEKTWMSQFLYELINN
jgi:hypothetical protein